MSESLCYSCKLKERCNQSKIRLHTLLYSHNSYCEKVDAFYVLQLKLSLLRQAVADEMKKTEEVNMELSKLVKSNNRRSEWLKKVKKKDYHSKYKMAEIECTKKKTNLNRELSLLQKTRQTLIGTITKEIFHLKSPPTVTMVTSVTNQESSANKTTTNLYHADTDTDYELIDASHELTNSTKALTCTENRPPALSSIGYGFIPNSELLMDYLQQSYHSVMESRDNGYNCIIDDSPDINHLSDVSKGVSAALSMIIHLVSLLSKILNQPLPHPIVLPIVLSEFGRAKGRSLQELNRFVAKQDDNIVYLCFTQTVDHDVLISGDTIGNLLKLITSNALGRTGPFSCHPELLRYPRTRVKRTRVVSIDPVSDCEPPLLHTAHFGPTANTIATGEGESPTDNHDRWVIEDDYQSSDDNETNIDQGWEEVHEMIVPSTNSYFGLSPPSTTSKERLEYGVSYSDYTLNYGQHSALNSSDHSSNTAATGSGLFMGTLGSLLGSGWVKK